MKLETRFLALVLLAVTDFSFDFQDLLFTPAAASGDRRP